MIMNSPGVSSNGYPAIGWKNYTLTSNISASSEYAGYPATNAANPALNSVWFAAAVLGYSSVSISLAKPTSYLGIAGHNFGTYKIGAYAIAFGQTDISTVISLHFIGPTDSTSIVEDSVYTSRPWTAHGNARIVTDVSKFGHSSLYCDGTGDYVDTPDASEFNFGASDFTIQCWVKAAVDDASYHHICGQCDAAGIVNANSSFLIQRSNGNKIQAAVAQGGSAFFVTSTSDLLIATGWVFIEFVRTGNILKLFINGIQEGGDAAFSGSVNNSSAAFGIGSTGDDTNALWNGWIGGLHLDLGLARHTANFTPPTAPFNTEIAQAYAVPDTFYKSIVRFDGPNVSTFFRDDLSKTWTATNITIDTTLDGPPAGYFTGNNGDGLTTPDHSDFALGSGDFTIEFWIKRPPGSDYWYGEVVGQWVTNDASSSFYFDVLSDTGIVKFYTLVSSTNYIVTSTTGVRVANGWVHVAGTRNGNILRLFLNGVQEGGDVAISGSINDSASPLGIGNLGGFTSKTWWGWIDDFKFTNGLARYTANFTPPTRQSESSIPADDSPLIFRFSLNDYTRIQLQMLDGDGYPMVGTAYAGELLELERGVAIDVGHTPINMGRKARVMNGKSEAGNFVGRIVTSQWNEGGIDFKWFTPDWYRLNFDPFLREAVESPFFIAWNPAEYPTETGYCWLIDDPKPIVDPVTRRISVSLKYQGDAPV